MLTVSAGNLYMGNTNRCVRFVLCPKINLYMLALRNSENHDFTVEFYICHDDIEQYDLIEKKCVYDADQTG